MRPKRRIHQDQQGLPLVKLESEARFNQARKQLSAALKNLEEAVKEKIHEALLNTDLLATDDESKLVAMSRMGIEVNHLQNELAELGKEAEFLRETNKILGQRISIFRQQKNNLVDAVEADLAAIHEVIGKYDS